MKNGRVVGVGCFGKPETLKHLFARVLNGCLLGDMEKLWTFLSDADAYSKIRTITGFFLALDESRVNLHIFTQGRDQRRERFASMRQFRLMGQ